MKRLLFLDIDGVLNSGEYTKKLDHTMITDGNGDFPDIDPEAMNRLNSIINETDCEVILSSGWRNFPNIKEHLLECGLCKPIKDVTPVSFVSRGYEIYYYLQTNNWDKKYDKFVILDDNDFDISVNFPYNFIQTTFQYGLTDELTTEIINRLK